MDKLRFKDERKRKTYDTKLALKADKDVYKQAIRSEKQKYEEEKDSTRKHKSFQRLKSLFQRATNNFPKEKSFWLDYVELCIDEGDFETACFISKKMINFHTDDYKMWLIATELHVTKMKDFKGALKLLKEAMHYHNLDTNLVKKYFELLLKSSNQNCIIKVKTEDGIPIKCEKDDEAVQDLEKAKNVFLVSQRTINNVNFYIDLIDIASKYQNTLDLRKNLYDHIKVEYSNHEITSHYLAQAELLINPKSDMKYDNCIKKYQEACRKFQTESMANYYLNALIDLHIEIFDSKNYDSGKRIKEKLINAFEECHNLKIMPKEKYIKWADFVETSQLKEEIFDKGLKIYPDAEELWEKYFQSFVLNNHDKTEIEDIFKNAVNNCGNVLSLWTMYLQYHMISSSNRVIRDKFKESMKHFDKFKVDYIEWLSMVYGQTAAMKAYSEMTAHSEELKAKMSLINKWEELPISVMKKSNR